HYDKANVLAVTPLAIPGLGTSGGFSMMLQDHQTVDIKQFASVVGQFLAAANQRPEIGMAYTLFSSDSPNFKISVKREQAKRVSVPVSTVDSTMSAYVVSASVNDFARYGREFRVVTQVDGEVRRQVEERSEDY